MTEWVAPTPPTAPAVDAEAYALEESLRSLVYLGMVTSERSTQVSIGSSEAGHVCDRRIAYRLAGVPSSNLRDMLPAFVGTGFHLAVADLFRRLSGQSGRFLVEHRVAYRGIPGTVDLYDRYTHTVIDWKTTTKSKLSSLRHDGPSRQYVTQVQLYGAGLAGAGEDVKRVALAFVPVDGELAGMWVWRAAFDRSVADAAVDRVDAIATAIEADGPAAITATPDRLCGWCHHYRPHSTDLTTGCPGPVT